MKKKFKISTNMILSMILLCACVITLCLIFIPANSTLSLDVHDLVVIQGQSGEIKYDCNQKADIKIEIYDSSIASLQGNVVMGIKTGSTTIRITATYKNEKAIKSANLTVLEDYNGPLTNLPETLKLYQLDKNIDKANEDNIFNEYPFEELRPLDYEIVGDDKNIIEISNNVIKAKKAGDVEILFSAKNSQTMQRVAVNIEIVPPTEILFTQDVYDVDVGDSVTLDYDFEPCYYTGKPVVNMEYNSDLIKIEDKTFTALSSGKTTIKVYLNGEFACDIAVNIYSNATLDISVIENCSYDNGVLKVLRGMQSKFFVKLSAVTDDLLYKTLSGDAEIIDREINAYYLTASQNSKIEFYSKKLMFSQIILIEVVENL